MVNQNVKAVVCEGITKSFNLKGIGQLKAVDDITATLYRGEFVGIVGKNGSGKSTLLRILAGIIKPSRGMAKLYGSVLSVLEVGAGFHPELSGRENVLISGIQLGYSAKQMERLLPEILSFSELEEFVETPVKFYSQGMYLRLALTIVFYLPADIYLLDEVVSVGDEAFRKKCLNKIKQLSSEGKTFVIVSHSFNEVAALCTRCLVLSHGKLVADGKPEMVYEGYEKSIGSTIYAENIREVKLRYDYPGYITIENFTFQKNNAQPFTQEDSIEFIIEWTKIDSGYGVAFFLNFFDEINRQLINSSDIIGTEFENIGELNFNKKGKFIQRCILPSCFLNIGRFKVRLAVGIFRNINDHFTAAETDGYLEFSIVRETGNENKKFFGKTMSPICTKFTWSQEVVSENVSRN